MSLFDEEELMQSPSSGAQSYGVPERTFSDEATVTKPPALNPSEQQFQQYQAHQAELKDSKSDASGSKYNYDIYKGRLDNWASQNIGDLYRSEDYGVGLEPEGTDPEQWLKGLDTHYSMRPELDRTKYDNIRSGYDKRKANLLSYQSQKEADENRYMAANDRERVVPENFVAAFDAWESTGGGSRPNGRPSDYLDPGKANEILDFLNFGDPGPKRFLSTNESLSKVDPRYEFSGIGSRNLNERQFKRRQEIMQGDLESLLGEERTYSKFKNAGYIGAPTWMNKVGGQSRFITEEERRHNLITAARDSGITSLKGPDGELIDVDNYQSGYSPDEEQAIKLMEQLGSAKTALAQKQIEFFSGLKSLKDKANTDALNEMELLTHTRDETAKRLEALGFGGELMRRAESVSDVGMIKGWAQSGWYQQKMADFSDNLVGGADNMSADDFQAMASLAMDQQILQEQLAANGDSPLASLMKKSKEEQDDWFDAIGRWFGTGDGYLAMAELVVTNLSGFLPEYVDTGKYTIPAGAGIGALATSWTGVGMIPGAIAGSAKAAKVNWAVTSASMEYAASVLEFLQEEGVDVHNPKAFAAAWANPVIRNEIQTKAAKRTGFIALMDAVSAGMAGKVMPVLKTPSVLKKLPGSMRMKNQNLKGLSLEETQELKKLTRANRKKSFQKGSKDSERMSALRSRSGSTLENSFGRAFRDSNERVNRSTFLHRARNASAELAFGGATGGGGELGAQLLTREPGEALDKQAILAEMFGEVVSPGGLAAMREIAIAPDLRDRMGVVESSTNIDPNTGTGGGTVESMNNNGWKFERNYFEQSQDAVEYLARSGNIELEVDDGKGGMKPNPELQFLNEYISGIHGIMGRKGLKVKYVVSNRTPEGPNNGGYQRREGDDYVVYLNPDALAKNGDNIISGLLHELPHVLSEGFYGNERIYSWYDNLALEEKRQSFAHYFFKDRFPQTKVSEIENALKTTGESKLFSDFEKAFDLTQTNEAQRHIAAHEWFSFEFVRVLAGQIQDASKVTTTQTVTKAGGGVTQAPTSLPAGQAADILAFIDQYIFPMYKKYIGSAPMEAASRAVPSSIAARGKGEVGIEDDKLRAKIKADSLGGGVTARPGRLGPEQMYAQLIYDMGWHSGTGGKLSYIGPDKPIQVGEQTSFSGMFQNTNKLIGEDRLLDRLSSIIQTTPGLEQRVTPKTSEQKAQDPSGDPFIVSEPEGFETSSEEIINFIRSELGSTEVESKSSRGEEDQAALSEVRERVKGRILEQMNRASVTEKFEPINSNIPGANEGLRKFFEDKGRPNKGTYTIISDAYREIQKLIAGSPDGSINFEGDDYNAQRAVELQNLIFSMKDRYEKVAEARADKAIKEIQAGTKPSDKEGIDREPAVVTDAENRTLIDTFKSEEDNKKKEALRQDIEIEGIAKLFKSQTGKDLSEVMETLDELTQDEKALRKKLEPLAKKLRKERGAVTDAELYSALLDSEGFSILANWNINKAIASIGDVNIKDEDSVMEAAAEVEQQVESDLARLQDRIDDIELSIGAEERIQKELEKGVATPKKKEGEKFSDKQMSDLVNSIKTAVRNFKADDTSKAGTTKDQLKQFLQDNLKTGDDDLINNLTDYLSAPVIDNEGKVSNEIAYGRKMDMLSRELVPLKNAGNKEVVVGMITAQGKIMDSLREGKLTSIVSTETKQKVEASKEKVTRRKAQKKKLQTVKTALTLGTQAGNLDYRDVPALVNFVPDSKMEKGTDLSQLMNTDGRRVTLGELAENDSLTVYLANDPNKKTFNVNGKKILTKMDSNYNWENLSEAETRKFKNDHGVEWHEYATDVITALASIREGTVVQTKRGPMSTSYLMAEVGVNKYAILFERIRRLAQRAKKNPEKYTNLEGLTDYESSIAQRDAEARRSRINDPVVKEIQDKRKDFYDALYGPNPKGDYATAVEDKEGNFIKWSSDNAAGTRKDISRILNARNYKEHKKEIAKNQTINSRLAPVIKEIEDTVESLKGRLKKKVRVQDVMESMGIGPRALQNANLEVTQRPIGMLPKDLLNINLTAGRIAEQLFSEDTSVIQQVRYNHNLKNYLLQAEQNLVADLEYLDILLKTGRAPKKTLSMDLYLDEGDVFSYNSRLYKAKKAFTVTPGTFNIIDSLASEIETIGKIDKDSTVALTKSELKEIETTFKRVEKSVKNLNTLRGEEFFPSNVLAGRPKVHDMTGAIVDVDKIVDKDVMLGKWRLGEDGEFVETSISMATQEYKHLAMLMNEAIAEKGSVTGQGSYIQMIPGKSKGVSHMEQFHTESAAIAKDKQRNSQIESIADMLMLNIDASRELTRLAISKARNIEDPNAEFAPVDFDGLDKQYNMGKLFLQAQLDGDFRVYNLLGVKDKKGRTITDPAVINADTELLKQRNDNLLDLRNRLKNFDIPFDDTFGYREDPQLSAIGMDADSHSYVSDIMKEISKLEREGETETNLIKLSKPDIKKIWESLGKTESEKKFIRDNFISAEGDVFVRFDPTVDKQILYTETPSLEFDQRLQQLHKDMNSGDNFLFEKGESFYLNGSKYDLKVELSKADQEAKAILTILQGKGEENSQKAELQQLFDKSPKVFKKTETPRNSPERVDLRTHRFGKDQVKAFDNAISMLENKEDSEEATKAIEILKGHRDSLQDFIDNGTKVTDWKKPHLIMGGVPVKASLVRDGDSLYLQRAESGNFVDQNGKALPGKVTDVLFEFLEIKNRLKTDPNDTVALRKKAFSSLTISPRQLITWLADSGGVVNLGLGRLSGMMRKYGFQEALGTLELLPYLDKLPGMMLDDLQRAGGVDAIIKNLNENLEEVKAQKRDNDPRVTRIESEINLYEAIKEGDLKLKDVPILLYISKFRMDDISTRPLSSDKALAQKDKDEISTRITNPTKGTLTLALEGKLDNVRDNSIIKVGEKPAEKDVESGRVVQRAQPVYARVKVADVNEETKTQNAVSYEDFLGRQEEDSVADTNLKDRWPKKKKERADESDKEDFLKPAYVYELEFVYDQNEVARAFYEAERDNLLNFSKQDKKAIANINEKLIEIGDSPEASRINDLRKLFSNYNKIGYLKKSDPKLWSRILNDIQNEDNFLQANLRMLARVVDDMNGIRITDYDAVVDAQKQADKQASEDYASEDTVSIEGESFVDGVSVDDDPNLGSDAGNPSVSEGSRRDARPHQGGKDPFDVDGGLSNQFSASGFYRIRPDNMIERAAKRFSDALKLFRDKTLGRQAPDEFDKYGQKINKNTGTWSSEHAGLYGKFVEQFGPFMKAEAQALKVLNLNDDDKRRLRITDHFYQGMGKAGDLLDEGTREFVNPVIDAFHETKASQTDIGWYLYALVAPQANKAIYDNRNKAGMKQIDPEGNPINSGLSNEEAQKLITALEDRPEVRAFIQHKNNPIKTMFDMHARSLDLMKQSDLLTADQYGAMKNASREIIKFKHDARLGKINFGANRRLPLKGFLGEDDIQYSQAEDIADVLAKSGSRAGKGFDQPRQSISLPAMGRENVAALANPDTIFAHTVQDYQESVIRSSRSSAAQSILNLYNQLQAATSEGNERAKELFERFFNTKPVKLQVKTRNVEIDGKDVYQIKEVEVPKEVADSQRALFVRDRGKPMLLQFADTDEGAALASAAKNLTYEELNQWMSVLNMGTKFMSRAVTSYSPSFWFRNPIRDISSAWFNLGNLRQDMTPIEKSQMKGIRNSVVNPITFAPDAAKIMKYEKHIDKFGKAPSNFDTMEESTLIELAKEDISAAYHLLKKQGGKTSFYKFESVSEILKKMDKLVKSGRKTPLKKTLGFITESVNILNTALENVLRARVLKEGLKAGLNIQDMVAEARNVTVDFNKRGTWSQQLGTFVQFANPGIQGNRRFIQALTARGASGIAGIGIPLATFSFALNTLSRLLTGREDDEEDDYSSYFDDIPARERYTSLVLSSKMFGDDENPSHLSIPFAYGPHIFWAMGDFLSKLGVSGGKTIVEDSLEFARTMYATTSPVTTLNPFPVAVPLTDLRQNENWVGNPIYPEFAGTETMSPEQLKMASTPEIYNDMAVFFNSKIMGGDAQTAGSVRSIFGLYDPVEFSGKANLTVGGAFSGPGWHFAVKNYSPLLEDALDIANLYNLNARDMKGLTESLPGLGGILRTKSPNYATLGRYYDLRQRAMSAEEKLKSMGVKEQSEFDKENPHYRKMIKTVRNAEAQMNMYRRKKRALEEAIEKNPQKEELIQQLGKLENIRNNIMRGIIGKAIDLDINV